MKGPSFCGTHCSEKKPGEGYGGDGWGSCSERAALGYPQQETVWGTSRVSPPRGLGAGTCGVPGLLRSAGQVRARSAQPGGATSVPALPASRAGAGLGRAGWGRGGGAFPGLALSPVFSLQALVPSLFDPVFVRRGSFVRLDGAPQVRVLRAPGVRVSLR